MKSTYILILFFLSFLSLPTNALAQQNKTTYIFVRHAEKVTSDPKNRDPKLTVQGKDRANRLAYILKDMPVDQIYSTNYIRTKETAKPTAVSKNLEISLYDPRDLYNKEFIKKTKNHTVLIVGHSNTTPTFVNKVLNTKKYNSIDEKDYGNLFIVTITENNQTNDMLLHY